jgi:Right handed beta helix region
VRPALTATLALLAVPALAQETKYTGCIRSADGVLYNVAQGSAPKAPCRERDTQITWNKAGPTGPAGPPGSSLPPPVRLDVVCDGDDSELQSINAALAYPAESITISISGTCHEEVVINRDHVTLVAADPNKPPTLTHDGNPVTVSDARDVSLYGLIITGSPSGTNNGVLISNSSVTVASCNISGKGTGVLSEGPSALSISNSRIHHNQGTGVVAWPGGVVSIENAHVEYNTGGGIGGHASYFYVLSSTITHNGYGVGIGATGAALMDSVDVSYSIQEGVSAGGSTSVSIRNSTLTHNGQAAVACQDNCSLSLGSGTEISDNAFGILLRGGSNLDVGGDNVMTRNGRGIWAIYSTFSTGGLRIFGNTGIGILCEPSVGTCVSGNVTDEIRDCGPRCSH